MQKCFPKELGQHLSFMGLVGAGIFVQLCWCINYHQQRWTELIAPVEQTPVQAGEGLVIHCNGLGYYSWLRSALVDRDWSFDNEFDEHNPLGNYVPPATYRTPLGRRANQWSVGPACLWAVTVVPLHVFLKATGGNDSGWAPNGYSLPYQLAVAGMALFCAVGGLGCLYGVCRRFASSSRAALAAASLTLGTTIFYYNAIEISLPHGPGTAVMAGLVWYWLTSYGSCRPRRWFLLGVLLGVATLMRWQLATFALLPAGEAALSGYHRCQRMYGRLSCQPVIWLGLAAVGAIIAFTPQMLAWRSVYGTWLPSPIRQVRYHWLAPSLWDVLFSQDRSLFYWTPLAFLALVGMLIGLVRGATNSSGRSAVHCWKKSCAPAKDPSAVCVCTFRFSRAFHVPRGL